MAKSKVVQAAIKSLEANGKAVDQLASEPLQECVKTLNRVLLDLLKNDTA